MIWFELNFLFCVQVVVTAANDYFLLLWTLHSYTMITFSSLFLLLWTVLCLVPHNFFLLLRTVLRWIPYNLFFLNDTMLDITRLLFLLWTVLCWIPHGFVFAFASFCFHLFFFFVWMVLRCISLDYFFFLNNTVLDITQFFFAFASFLLSFVVVTTPHSCVMFVSSYSFASIQFDYLIHHWW